MSSISQNTFVDFKASGRNIGFGVGGLNADDVKADITFAIKDSSKTYFIENFITEDAAQYDLFELELPENNKGPNYIIHVRVLLTAIRTDDPALPASDVGTLIKKEFMLTYFNDVVNTQEIYDSSFPGATNLTATMVGYFIKIAGELSKTYLWGGTVTITYVN